MLLEVKAAARPNYWVGQASPKRKSAFQQLGDVPLQASVASLAKAELVVHVTQIMIFGPSLLF